VLRTVNDQPTLWESILPAELLVLPGELARVDALLEARSRHPLVHAILSRW
jgi:IS5 family transposase